MAVPEDIRRLAREVRSPPGESLPAGASDADIVAFSSRTGVQVPSILHDWLRFTNGPCIGPGGMYGVRARRANLDIENQYRHHPEWRLRNWIPIAGDGCGNHYLLTPTIGTLGPSYMVCFFDHEQGDPQRLEYVVASSLWTFLRFLFRRELGERGWPFNSSFVLAADPDLHACANLPWSH